METKKPEDDFRRDLRMFTHVIKDRFGFDQRRSISIDHGESLDIDPTYRYGVIFRLISHDDRSGYEHRMSFVLRRTADIDFLDEGLRYIPLENLDRFEASTRISQAQEALNSNSNL